MRHNKIKPSKTEKSIQNCPEVFISTFSEKTAKHQASKNWKIKRVKWIGTGSSYHVCEWNNWFMNFFSKYQSTAISSWDFLARGSVVSPDELVIVVSQRGAQDLTEKVLSNIASHKMKIIICSEGAKTKNTLHWYGTKTERSKSHTVSLFAAIKRSIEVLMHFNLLLPEFDKRMGDDFYSTAEILTSVEREMSEQSFHVEELFPKSILSYSWNLIGGGPFEVIAKEIALKAREMSRTRSCSIGLEEALHGPISGFKKDDIVVLFNTLSGSKDKTKQFLYHDRFSKLLKVLSKTESHALIPEFESSLQHSIAMIHPMFQSLIFLYWGQWQMLFLAKAKGTNPDLNPFL